MFSHGPDPGDKRHVSMFSCDAAIVWGLWIADRTRNETLRIFHNLSEGSYAPTRAFNHNTAASPIQVSSPIGPQVSQVQNAVLWLVQVSLVSQKNSANAPSNHNKSRYLVSIYFKLQDKKRQESLLHAACCSAAVLH